MKVRPHSELEGWLKSHQNKDEDDIFDPDAPDLPDEYIKARDEAIKNKESQKGKRKTNLFDKFRAPLKEPLHADYKKKNWAKMRGIIKRIHEKAERHKTNPMPKGLKKSKLYQKGNPLYDPELWDKPDNYTRKAPESTT